MNWYVYILRCRDNSLYTGITNNIKRRMHIHAVGRGSKYVKARLPFVLVYTAQVDGKSEALKLEYKIKKISKIEKEKLICEH